MAVRHDTICNTSYGYFKAFSCHLSFPPFYLFFTSHPLRKNRHFFFYNRHIDNDTKQQLYLKTFACQQKLLFFSAIKTSHTRHFLTMSRSGTPLPSAAVLMKQYKELTDPKTGVPSFHITLKNDDIYQW